MKSMKQVRYKAGKVLITENDLARKLYILKKGKVRVYKQYMGGKITLAILSPGEIFGELSFFDSKPRSATIEAITDVVVDCIDGEQLNDQIESLPNWVHLIFQSISSRFRVVDQKMTVLQSLSNFQRKVLGNDSVGNTIYTDMLRLIKILKMIIEDKKVTLTKKELVKELDLTAGPTHVSAKTFLNILIDYDFVAYDDLQNKEEFNICEEKLNQFENFLRKEYEQDTCTILKGHSIGMLRKIISFIDDKEFDKKGEFVLIPDSAISYDDENKDYHEAFNQLRKLKLVHKEKDGIYTEPYHIAKLFKYHSIIKSFDHSVSEVF